MGEMIGKLIKTIITDIKEFPWFMKLILLMVIAGVGAAFLRLVLGLGATTNMNDQYPWGLWVAFDVVTAVPLAAGAFTLGAIVHVFHIKALEPLYRPAIVTGFLGYSLVCVGLLLDIGQPHHGPNVIWPPFWNIHSPMFEVSLCVASYTTVLCLEFLPFIFERFNICHIPLRLIRWLEMPLVILAAMISTLHQSTLGTFFLIAVDKLHNLWYNPLLPVLFYTSAICVGMCIIIIEASATHMYLDQPDETKLLKTLCNILPWGISLYAVLKVYATFVLGEGPYFDRPWLTMMFAVEILLMIVIPLAILAFKKNRETNFTQLLAAHSFAIGLVINRFNVSMFGMQIEGNPYIPSIIEVVVTLGIFGAHILFFVICAKHLPIFEHHPETMDDTAADHFHPVKSH